MLDRCLGAAVKIVANFKIDVSCSEGQQINTLASCAKVFTKGSAIAEPMSGPAEADRQKVTHSSHEPNDGISASLSESGRAGVHPGWP